MRAAYDDRPIQGSPGSYERGWARLLWWGALGKFDALLNVSFKALDSNIKKLLLILGGALKDVNGFLDAVRLFVLLACPRGFRNVNPNTYPKFDRSREKVNAGGLRDIRTSRNTWEVDVAWFDNAGLALGGLDDALSKPVVELVLNITLGSHGMPDLKPAKAMDRVADPAPSLALTTSSPPN